MRDKINKYLGENNLTFTGSSDLNANFLGRNKKLVLPENGVPDIDHRADLKKLSAGFVNKGGRGLFLSKKQPVGYVGVNNAESDMFKREQMFKALGNLKEKGETVDSISKMVSTVRSEIYPDRTGTQPPQSTDQVKNYLGYVDRFKDYDNTYASINQDFGALNSIDDYKGLDNNSMKSLLALGVKKQDYFGDMFSHVAEEAPLDQLNDIDKKVMKDFADTTMRLSGVGDHMLEKGKTSDIAYAMKLKCS